MDKFHIKKVSSLDKNKLFRFYQNSFNYDNSNPDILNWRYRTGFKNFEPIVLEVGGEICGHAGLIANDLKVKDKIKTGIWFTDFYIQEKYRSLGYGKLLTQAWMKICPIQITLCNEKSLKIFKKMDWSYNKKFIRKMKTSNFLNLIPIYKKLDISNLDTNNLENLKLEVIDNQTISKISKESEQYLSQKLFGIVRDENWFKWRVLDCPYKKNIFIFSYKDISIITEIKIKRNYKILNIIYTSKPINNSLVNIFRRFIKRNNINFISYISKNNKTFNIDFPWNKKLNFAFNAEDASDKSLISDYFDDIQYIDSEINFI